MILCQMVLGSGICDTSSGKKMVSKKKANKIIREKKTESMTWNQLAQGISSGRDWIMTYRC